MLLEDIIQLNKVGSSVYELNDFIRQGIPSAVFGVSDSFKNYLISVIEGPVLYVAKDGVSAIKSVQAIKEFCDKKVVLLPAKDETLTSFKAFSKDVLFERIDALSKIGDADVIVITPEALLQKYPKSVKSYVVKKGDNLGRDFLINEFVLLGYKRTESVESKGTFCVKGDAVSVFPVNSELPLRVSFFDDEIESINFFEEETHKNLGVIESFTVLSSSECIFDYGELSEIEKILKEEISTCEKDKKVRLKTLLDEFVLSVQLNDFSALTNYFSLSTNSAFILDVIKKETTVIFDEGKRVYDFCELIEREFNERFTLLSKEGGVFSFAKNNLIGLEDFKNKLKGFKTCSFQNISTANGFFSPLKIINPKISSITNYRLDFKEIFTDVNAWLKTGYSVLIFTGDVKRAQNLSAEFSAKKIPSVIDCKEKLNGVVILSDKAEDGFIFHENKTVIIGSGNLYSKKVAERKIKKGKQSFFTAPEKGDYAVHEIHGIGRVIGNKKITTTEGEKDYIAVEYSGGDILYVPVEQMDILTKYLGGEKHPRLSKIGGKDFDKIKRSVKESIKKMSFDLKKLYEERDSVKGYTFRCDEEIEDAFYSAFPFEDTFDQTVATEEIKKDMVSEKVMDRLVCGDVGFGKTEVAFRAVFRAFANGKQVAMLAPTTILTEQHYNTALERFKDFGIKIAVLNRFKTQKEQKEIIEGLKEGTIDFVIGTHRLLSKDVGFYDLGLLVLDEEQRFGVEHKEKIKLIKKNVDTITLTATPIPRTLHMSLTGIRDISTINTPPASRLPVQTYVTEETETLIVDAVKREMNRGGQVFILYNRVESIFTFAERIRSLLDKARITVAHGQMEERVLEKNILEFYRGESDILIATTIIENGIDLPKANTLIVIDADTLGLSTLYQLKGRVGRSDRLAYAYFTYKREKILTSEAYERLSALMEFTEMGSGMKIAMRDLEIRGAGNVLGSEQHGHMDKIGYELYSKLLREELEGREEITVDLDIRVSAFIPEDYIGSSSARMAAYKEIAEINSLTSEKETREFLFEAYGDIPEETDNLILIATVKYLSAPFGVTEINVTKDRCNLAFANFKCFSNEVLAGKISDFNGEAYISVSGKPSLEFKINGRSNREMLGRIKEFFKEK